MSRRNSIQGMCRVGVTEKQYTGYVYGGCHGEAVYRVCVWWVSRRSSIQGMCRVGVTEKQYTGYVYGGVTEDQLQTV